MGTDVSITLYSKDKARGTAALESAFKTVRELSYRLSDYEPESELSQLSAKSPGESVVTEPLWAVLLEGQKIAAASGGAFDMTVGPISRLWRRARRQKKLPGDSLVAAALRSSGYRHLVVDTQKHKVRLKASSMRLDLGGIAKGFVADRAMAVLRKEKLSRASINAGGDLVLGSPPPGKNGWKIGLAPLNPKDPPSRFYELHNCGVATSGDAWQYLEIGGRRFSHIIDPRKGRPVEGRSSVTVIAATGLEADAWASALSVLGPAGFDKINKHQTRRYSALILRQDSGRIVQHESEGFKKLAPTSKNEDR